MTSTVTSTQPSTVAANPANNGIRARIGGSIQQLLAFVSLLVPSGADAARATALSLLFLALGLIGTLPGGIIYVFADQSEPRGAQPS